jgi:pimeloyl-ACP methyl ester carboxylesterase
MKSSLQVGAPATFSPATVADDARPRVVKTQRGPVECATFGSGPAVLALHGAMGGYDQSLILARTICSPGFRFVAVSRPGYLGTPLASGRSPEAQADLCAALLDSLGITDTAVVAVSGGGPTAIQFALRHQQRCRCLVMVSAASARIDAPPPLAWYVMKLMARIPGLPEKLRKKALQDPERSLTQSFPDPAQRAHLLQDHEALALHTDLQMSVLSQLPLRLPGTDNDIAVTRSNSFDQVPLEKIAVPVLAVHGESDRIVPFAKNAQRLVSRVTGAELLAIKGGEHACIFTNRDEVRTRVADFLAAHAEMSADSSCVGNCLCRDGAVPRP